MTDTGIRRATAVSGEELTEWIKRIPVLKQVMVLDTCDAGELAAKLTAIRSLSSDQIRAIDRLKDRTGFHVLMGSAADAVSYEASRYGQGVLTYALLQGMKGAALKENRYVDISKLFQYAADTVPLLAHDIGGIQRPQYIAPKRAESFDIGLLREEDRRQISLASPRPQMLKPSLQNPGALRDNLRLEAKMREYLREVSYAAHVRGRSVRLPVIYIDVDELPGSIRPSGIYTIEGDTVRVKLGLFRNGNELLRLQATGSASDLEALVEKLVDEMLMAVENMKTATSTEGPRRAN